MKRTLLYGMMLLWACVAAAQGIPFIKNYTSDDYHAHNRNFDVITTDDGSVFIANFEGLLYYNNVEWRIIHTPGITRITVIYKDRNNEIWAGGYNYFGKIQRKGNGELYLQTVGKQGAFRGEVQEIWEEKDNSLNFFVNDGNIYEVKDNQFHIKKQISKERLGIGLSDVVDIDTCRMLPRESHWETVWWLSSNVVKDLSLLTTMVRSFIRLRKPMVSVQIV